MVSRYDQALQEAAVNNPIWGNGGNGHSQQADQVPKPASEMSVRKEQNKETPAVRISAHEIEETKKKAKEKKKCVECGSSTTTLRQTDGKPHWYKSKNQQKPGRVCNTCYFRLWRQERKKKENERPFMAGMKSKLDVLQPLFERQAKLLAEKQAAIKKRLQEIEKEKVALLAEAQEITVQLGG